MFENKKTFWIETAAEKKRKNCHQQCLFVWIQFDCCQGNGNENENEWMNEKKIIVCVCNTLKSIDSLSMT